MSAVRAVQVPRRVERLVVGEPTSDGAGVKLVRVLSQSLHRRLDPFLMLDAFGSEEASDYIAGFPNHPHRGFETVTYMLEGRMLHRDSAGNEGLLASGDVQWMTAGRGLVHSEMPQQEEGRMEGFQLWLNLPAQDKMCAPNYRDIGSQQIPEVSLPGGGLVRVIAGSCHGVAGAVQRPQTEPTYLDVHLPAGATLEQPLAPTHNAFVYVYRGSVWIGEQEVGVQRMAILSTDQSADGVALRAGAQGLRALLIAGQPLNEPIVQYGPFVMNTTEQIHQAVNDYRAGLMG